VNVGTHLVTKAINRMKEKGCEEVVLETEITNKGIPSLLPFFIVDRPLSLHHALAHSSIINPLRSFESLPEPWIREGQTTVSVLSEWRRCFQTQSLVCLRLARIRF